MIVFVCFVYGFYFVYCRLKVVECVEGFYCVCLLFYWNVKIGFWVVIVLIIIVVGFFYVVCFVFDV